MEEQVQSDIVSPEHRSDHAATQAERTVAAPVAGEAVVRRTLVFDGGEPGFDGDRHRQRVAHLRQQANNGP